MNITQTKKQNYHKNNKTKGEKTMEKNKTITIPILCTSLTMLGCWTIDKSLTAYQNDAGFTMIILSILLIIFYYDNKIIEIKKFT
jgi:cell division protein FtsW (lipid II flippase)